MFLYDNQWKFGTFSILFKKMFSKKLEYHFLAESTKIETVSFPYKTAILEANVKTSRMVSTK